MYAKTNFAQRLNKKKICILYATSPKVESGIALSSIFLFFFAGNSIFWALPAKLGEVMVSSYLVRIIIQGAWLGRAWLTRLEKMAIADPCNKNHGGQALQKGTYPKKSLNNFFTNYPNHMLHSCDHLN